jgi:hypothetical protein
VRTLARMAWDEPSAATLPVRRPPPLPVPCTPIKPKRACHSHAHAHAFTWFCATPLHSDSTKGELMYSGCICCYSAFNFDKIFVLCKQSGTCICVESKGCLAAGEPTFPVGLIQQEGFICKLGLPCCTYGLKVPDTNDLISSDAVCLCARSVAQFPFGDKSA